MCSMSRTKVVILAAFVLVLGAGVVAGRLWARLPGAVTPEGRSPSWLADQLNLTSEQRQQMDAIWAEAKQKLDQKVERRRSLDHERDQAIADLLGPEQWAAYGRLVDDFRAKRNEVDKERFALIRDANERSRALLAEGQRKTWDQIRQSHRERDRERDGRKGGGERGRGFGTPSTRPTTNPV